MEPEPRHPRILVAPLNWGLGHVARCIPIINLLEKHGAEVLLASDGVALELLRAEFPHLQTFELPSYRVEYRSENMIWNIAKQLPRMIYAVQAEHTATEKLVQRFDVQGIISDNRYGCFSKKAKSVLLTHQLFPRIPNLFLEFPARYVLRKAMGRFGEIWVPDNEGEPNLSGELSHGQFAHPCVRFVGVLTRLKNYPKEREYDVAVVLSGPEPQRTMLENRLMDQAMALPQDFVFIQGKTQSKQHYRASENVEVVSFLTSRELNDVLMASRVIVCRSGYSSIMDLAALGKKAILVPTPGQTEQEYLADFLATKNAFLVQKQGKLDLEDGILKLGNTKGIGVETFENVGLEDLIRNWMFAL